MKCQNCPVDVKKLIEVEVSNLTTYDTFWICEECYNEEASIPFCGYIKKTGRERNEIILEGRGEHRTSTNQRIS